MTNDKTKVKERPILFSGPMVRAILDGRKTQTRRVVKPQPPNIAGAWFIERVYDFQMRFGPDEPCDAPLLKCSYGKPGQRLWVKETFRTIPQKLKRHTTQSEVYYRANWESRTAVERDITDARVNGRWPWRPSIFMPRWASRLTLEITRMRVERLQDISHNDVREEGTLISVTETGGLLLRMTGDYPPTRYITKKVLNDVTEEELFRAEYASLWDGLNAKRGHAWEKNPWVWVLEFKVQN